MYSTSKGSLHLVDTREAAICDSCSRCFEEKAYGRDHNFFSELNASISVLLIIAIISYTVFIILVLKFTIFSSQDAKFSRNGKYIATRDYVNVKIWDVRTEKAPVVSIEVLKKTKTGLADLYESEKIFDKFSVSFSYDDEVIATGGYNNKLSIFGVNGETVENVYLDDKEFPSSGEVAGQRVSCDCTVYYIVSVVVIYYNNHFFYRCRTVYFIPRKIYSQPPVLLDYTFLTVVLSRRPCQKNIILSSCSYTALPNM